MRVAVVLGDPPPRSERAGARRLGRLATDLADHGHDVTVYCRAWWEESGRSIEFDDLRYEAVTFEAGRLFYTRLPGVLLRARPDVILVSPAPPAAAVGAAAGGVLARAPVVCDWYGDEPGVGDSRWTGAAARAPTRVVTPSELHRTRVRELGAGDADARVVPPGIDVSLVESTPAGDRSDVIYARRLDADANLESLLLAMAELRGRDDWTATVVGEGPRREDYERQARDLGVGGRVDFVGECSREERVARYRGAHAFVQTARRSQFAEELLWALAAGCVGVVEYQDDSSAHELVEGRERGIRVTDSEALDDAIESAWKHEYRDRDGSFAAFDHDAVTDRYVNLFGECGVDGA